MRTDDTEPIAGAGPDTDSAGARPARLAVAAALVALEGVALAGVAVGMLVMLASGAPDSAVQAVTGALTVLALAVLPFATARGLWRLRRWSRSPAIFTQLLALPVGWQMASSTGFWVPGGLALAAVAVAVLVCLFHARSAEALGVGTGGPRGA
ncbi:hypothetical protein V1J52_05480 [Streptomyces sp. TRM 70351]|uniref:hypothetical protein n=1 Tax=Streptomyces sp. TRM 70351 TaxID=3116552 RepID=UPI002E7BB804|nr:hypothetical protein [Streptomyces sp. TRM 70351]MEE1927646.1 hypothetical protein [Streptomyces sp. TRM 70351]